MFAGAAREAVFSNPEVIRRVNEEFIPVALKAALVNNPPPGIEGRLYAEIGRSKPAPQGICTANSAGKVLAWALSFDDQKSILKFLDHVIDRYRQSPAAGSGVTAQRYMKFPSHPLAEVEDTKDSLDVPPQHADDQRCPAKPGYEKGTLVGRIIGRALDEDGNPVADTRRQEHYMEARFEMPVPAQQRLSLAAKQAGRQPFPLPDEFTRALIAPAFLGQLDVNPLGLVPGSRNLQRDWEFTGRLVESGDANVIRIGITGKSDVKGADEQGRRTDGRFWEHRVTLNWQGYADIDHDRLVQLAMRARGDEQLRWGNRRFHAITEADVEHLMAGHPIDLRCGVRYALVAEPVAPDEVADNARANQPRANQPRANQPGANQPGANQPGANQPGADRGRRLQAKMQRLQSGVQRLQRSADNLSKIGKLMSNFDPLMRDQKFNEAEALLDRALQLIGNDDDR